MNKLSDAQLVRLWKDDSTSVLLPVSIELSKKHLHELEQFPAHIWLMSSGSFSSQRFVGLSKDAFLSAAKSVNDLLSVEKDDCWCVSLPTTHVGGLAIYARASIADFRVVNFLENWDVGSFIDFIVLNRCTILSLVPTQLFDICKSETACPGQIRAVIIGGARIPEELYFKARSLGWPVLPSFGMTETCSQIATAKLESLKQDIFPKLYLLPHLDVRKAYDGALEIKGPSLLTSYASISNGELIFLDPKLGDWFPSKDHVEIIQDDGGVHLQPLGRADRRVKVFGELVSLDEVEAQVHNYLGHIGLGTAQCALVSKTHERKGAKLVLVTDDRRLNNSLLAALNSELPALQRVEGVYHVARMPRLQNGKLDYKALESESQA